MYIDHPSCEMVLCGTNKETELFEEVSSISYIERRYHPYRFILPRVVFERYQGKTFYPDDRQNRFKLQDELMEHYSFCQSVMTYKTEIGIDGVRTFSSVPKRCGFGTSVCQ